MRKITSRKIHYLRNRKFLPMSYQTSMISTQKTITATQFIKMILKGNILGMSFVTIFFSINTFFNYTFNSIFSQQMITAFTNYKKNQPFFSLLQPILTFYFVYIIQDAVFRAISIYYTKYIEPTLDAKLKITYLNRTMKNSYEFLSNSSTGYIMSILNQLTIPVKTIIKDISMKFIPNVFTCIGIVISLALIHWSLFLIVIFYMICCFIIFLATYKKIFYLNQRNIGAYSKNISNLTDVVMNFASVLLFSRKKYELERAKRIQHIESQRMEISGLFSQKLGIIMFSIWILCSILSDLDIIYLFFKEKISIANIVYVFGVVANTFAAINGIQQSLINLYSNSTILKNCLTILNSGKIADLTEGGQDITNIKGKIDIENLSFSYKDNDIFSNQNINIKAGEKVGIVGRSGAGKTTLINLIIRNLTPTNGRIMIDDKDISFLSDKSLKDCISVVSQDTTLFNRSVLDNIRYSKPNATMEEIIEVAKKANAHDFIVNLPLDYNTNVGEKGMLLSGGQRQRILIARAMLKNSPILILDEATSALDAENEKLIQEALDKLMENKTVIAIAHKLNTLKEMNRIIVLQNGKVVEQGTHTELMKNKNGVYKTLWDIQKAATIMMED